MKGADEHRLHVWVDVGDAVAGDAAIQYMSSALRKF